LDTSLKETAGRCGVSPPYLSHVISLRTGFGFRTHLQGLRIMFAAHLVASTPQSMKEIAHESGFAQTAVLDHEFERWFHMPPGEFRRLASTTAEDPGRPVSRRG
jgi:two-component system response regulator YesN